MTEEEYRAKILPSVLAATADTPILAQFRDEASVWVCGDDCAGGLLQDDVLAEIDAQRLALASLVIWAEETGLTGPIWDNARTALKGAQ